MFFNRKVEKTKRSVEKMNSKLDKLEMENQIQKEFAERKQKQVQRKDELEFEKKSMSQEELNENIWNAKQKLLDTRTELYDYMRYITWQLKDEEMKDDTDIVRNRKEKLRIKFKNAVYTMTLIEQTLEKLDDVKSEYKWRSIINGLTNGYKAINALSSGSDFTTRLSNKVQRIIMDVKNSKFSSENEKYFGKTTDHYLKQEGQKDVVDELVDIMVSGNYNDIEKMDRDSFFSALRDGKFISIDTDRFTKAAVSVSQDMLRENIDTEMKFKDENEPCSVDSLADTNENFLDNLKNDSFLK